MVAVPLPAPRVHAISTLWPHTARPLPPPICPTVSEWEWGRWGWILERKLLSMIVPPTPHLPELNGYLRVLWQ